jgi:hypothetical protein
MKVFRFLLGLAIGAGVALLFAPKSGRQLRHQLTGGGSGKLLDAGTGAFPEPERAEWGGVATAVAEPPVVEEAGPPLEPTWAPAPVVDEVVVTEVDERILVVQEPGLEEEPAGEDLRARIEETRAALENELAQPFGADASEQADEAALMADDAAAVAAAAETAAEDAIVDAVAAEIVAEEAVAEAEVAEVIAEEAVYEAVAADEVATESIADALSTGDEQAAVAAVQAAEDADDATTFAEEAVAEAEIAEVVAEEAVIEAAEAEAVAEEAIAEAVEEEELSAQAAEEADVAEQAAEEAIADEVVIDEAVTEELAAEDEQAPFAGPLPPPLAPAGPEVAEPEPVAEALPERHAWDIDYGETATPVEEEIVAEEPVADEAVVEEAVSQPASEEVVTEVEDKTVVIEEPVLEEPVAEAPVAEETVVIEEPEPAAAAAPEPATAREAGAIDQAEMRRRIEETRARLKAKAFDAMMSGEAALLSRDSGDRAVPTGEDHGLDEETDSAIDESLSQEDY